MTKATDAGFVVGNKYRVSDAKTTASEGVQGFDTGDIVTFTFDDESRCPRFTATDSDERDYYLFFDGLEPVQPGCTMTFPSGIVVESKTVENGVTCMKIEGSLSFTQLAAIYKALAEK